MRSITISLPYIGSCLSENHFRGRRRDGGFYVKSETRKWQGVLGSNINRELGLDDMKDWEFPLLVRCDGRFKNTHRQPDLHNLAKVICDGIERATGVNDQKMRWLCGDVTYGEPAVLVITISENGG